MIHPLCLIRAHWRTLGLWFRNLPAILSGAEFTPVSGHDYELSESHVHCQVEVLRCRICGDTSVGWKKTFPFFRLFTPSYVSPGKRPVIEDSRERTVRVEIEFALPVKVPSAFILDLHEWLDRLARLPENTPEGHIHWAFGAGSKPLFSQADAAFLGKPADPNAPESGEPGWDDSILYLETACREEYD